MEVQEETVMNVTKSYSLKGLDCPNCSAKIEKEVGELDGVQSLSGKSDEADAYNQCCSGQPQIR